MKSGYNAIPGRRHLLCSQSFVPVEAAVERGSVAGGSIAADIETTGMPVFSSPFDIRNEVAVSYAAALRGRKRRRPCR
jgi:hypothetical protein